MDRKKRETERERELTNDINECSARYDFSSTSAKGKKKGKKEKMPSVFVFFLPRLLHLSVIQL
jgi:hypothetical protein